MRFAILQRTDPADKAAGQALTAAPPGVTLHESAELAPHAAGARIVFADGVPHRSAPAPGDRRVQLTALRIVEAESRDAAVDWIRQAPVGQADAEFEIRETGCPGGLPGVDLSADIAGAKPRFLVLVKADAATEADAHADAARLDAMARCNDEAVARGLLLAADGLKSTARGVRVRFQSGTTRVMDGPFAEAKELIAGFWLIQVPSLDDAVDWVRRYPYAQDAPEIEIHPVAL